MSYEQPPPGQYGGAPYGGAPQQQPSTSVMAIISLVTGILGLCCAILSIAAIILGFLGRKEINESNGMKTGSGLATAGLVLGFISIGLNIIYWILIAAGALDGAFYYST